MRVVVWSRHRLRHNALYDLTIIWMIVPFGRFELCLVARLVYVRDRDGDGNNA